MYESEAVLIQELERQYGPRERRAILDLSVELQLAADDAARDALVRVAGHLSPNAKGMAQRLAKFNVPGFPKAPKPAPALDAEGLGHPEPTVGSRGHVGRRKKVGVE